MPYDLDLIGTECCWHTEGHHGSCWRTGNVGVTAVYRP